MPEEITVHFVNYWKFAPNKYQHDFAYYVLNNYMSDDALFTQFLWAAVPSAEPRTTNKPEAFHRDYTANFHSPHSPV